MVDLDFQLAEKYENEANQLVEKMSFQQEAELNLRLWVSQNYNTIGERKTKMIVRNELKKMKELL